MARLGTQTDEMQVALLRGVNVGPAKRVAMADLRALVAGLGFTEVQTLLNSGNVVYRCSGLAAHDAAARIELALAKGLALKVRVTVLSAAEVNAAVAENPLRELATDPSRLVVAVWATAQDRLRLLPLAERDWGADALAVGARVAYVWCPNRILECPLGDAVAKALGDAVTSRNWATLLKLQALMAERP